MHLDTLLQALVLGIIEGLTEFLPVSSTGHLLLAGHFLGFNDPGKSFEVLIQLGAILAILLLYARRLIRIAADLPSDPTARRFVFGVLLAFLPAAILGALFHGYITQVLFESPKLIAIMLIVGGVVLFIVDRIPFRPRYEDVMDLPLGVCLGIGIAQCLSLVPGVSRSGATIVGALFLGAEKRVAAEFSFFLAMPTMVGAFVFDAYQNRNGFTGGQTMLIAVGFVAAFLSALLVVKTFLDFVSRRGLTPFAWWRVIVGGIALNLLLLGH